MKNTIIIALSILSAGSCMAQNRDTTKPPPFVKAIPGDSIKRDIPVIEKIDTMKNNMPVVAPKKKNVNPK